MFAMGRAPKPVLSRGPAQLAAGVGKSSVRGEFSALRRPVRIVRAQVALSTSLAKLAKAQAGANGRPRLNCESQLVWTPVHACGPPEMARLGFAEDLRGTSM